MFVDSNNALHALTLRLQSKLLQSTEEMPAGRREVGLNDFVSRLVFQASVATLFNEEAGNDPELFAAFLAFDKQLPMAAAGISLSYFSEAAAARAKLLAAVGKHRTNNAELLQKRYQHFTEKDVPPADQLAFQLAMLWASVGNTMPTTFWLLFFLLRDPALLARARAEVEASFSEGASRSQLSQDQLNGLYFLDACITETLRLTSGSLIMRVAQRPTELILSSGNKYRFRKGDRVGLFPTLSHLDEEVFPAAQHFDPARWLGADSDSPEERMLACCGKKTLFKSGKEIAK